MIENLALWPQVTALKMERPRPTLGDADRAFWVALRTSWPGWASRLVIVKTDTVTQWSRDRFRRYWTKISEQRRLNKDTPVPRPVTMRPSPTAKVVALQRAGGLHWTLLYSRARISDS